MDEFWIDRMAVLGRVNAFLPKPQAFGAAERPVRSLSRMAHRRPTWVNSRRSQRTPSVRFGASWLAGGRLAEIAHDQRGHVVRGRKAVGEAIELGDQAIEEAIDGDGPRGGQDFD